MLGIAQLEEIDQANIEQELADAKLRADASDALRARMLREVETQRAERSRKLAYERWVAIMCGETAP